jgi:hypothetical protein
VGKISALFFGNMVSTVASVCDIIEDDYKVNSKE